MIPVSGCTSTSSNAAHPDYESRSHNNSLPLLQSMNRSRPSAALMRARLSVGVASWRCPYSLGSLFHGCRVGRRMFYLSSQPAGGAVDAYARRVGRSRRMVVECIQHCSGHGRVPGGLSGQTPPTLSALVSMRSIGIL